MKKDGHVEPFDRSKLLKSLMTATTKREVPVGLLENLVDSLESDIRFKFKGPIPSSALGDEVLKRIWDLDQVAYVRFASVYKDFQSIDEFTEELARLRHSVPGKS